MQDEGGVRAIRVGLQGQKAERPGWLSRKAWFPSAGCVAHSCHVTGAPLPAASPGLFLRFHRSCVSPCLPVPRYIQQLSPDSFHSSSVTQRPVVFISPLFLESILQDSFFSVSRRHASPLLSLPVLSCPSLFEKQVLERTLSCPLKSLPL